MTEFRLLKGTSGLVRTIAVDGRDHLVVPVVALMEGVIHAINAPSAEFVPLETLSVDPARWNEKPVVLGHPTRNGRQCSADDPMIRATHAFGVVRDAQIVNGKLACEAWLDEERVKALGAAAMLEKLRAGEMIDVSVGAFVTTSDESGDYNGKNYNGKWVQIVPDHLAFLPEAVGACSLSMGCGANRAAESVAEGGAQMTWKDKLLTTLAEFVEEIKKAGEPAARDPDPGVIVLEQSLDERISLVARAVEQKFKHVESSPMVQPGPYAYPYRVFDGHVVIQYDGKFFDCTYETNDEDAIVLGEPVEVTQEFVAAEGRRNSNADLEMIQTMHDHSTKLGASCHAGNVRALETEKKIDTPAETIQTDDVKAAAAIPPAAAIEPGTVTATVSADPGMAADAPDLRAAECGCKEKKPMTSEQKVELIRTLTECKYSGFTAADQPMLETASDERLESFKVAADARKQAEENLKVAAAKPMTEEDFMKLAPASLKSLIARQQRQETERKTELVTALKAAQEEYSEAELAAMSTEQLERMARVARLEAKPDYSGRGLSRFASDKADDVFANPPDPYAEAIKRQQGRAN